jgi:hypothetical protein
MEKQNDKKFDKFSFFLAWLTFIALCIHAFVSFIKEKPIPKSEDFEK